MLGSQPSAWCCWAVWAPKAVLRSAYRLKSRRSGASNWRSADDTAAKPLELIQHSEGQGNKPVKERRLPAQTFKEKRFRKFVTGYTLKA